MGYITTQSIGKPDLGPFKPPPDNISGQRGSNKIAIFRVKSHTMKVNIFGCFDQLKKLIIIYTETEICFGKDSPVSHPFIMLLIINHYPSDDDDDDDDDDDNDFDDEHQKLSQLERFLKKENH